MVYFCAFAHSEIFQKNARELGVSRGQFIQVSVGQYGKRFSSCKKFQAFTPFGFRPEKFQGF